MQGISSGRNYPSNSSTVLTKFQNSCLLIPNVQYSLLHQRLNIHVCSEKKINYRKLLTSKEDGYPSNELDQTPKSQWCKCIGTSKRHSHQSHFPHAKATRDKRLPAFTNTNCKSYKACCIEEYVYRTSHNFRDWHHFGALVVPSHVTALKLSFYYYYYLSWNNYCSGRRCRRAGNRKWHPNPAGVWWTMKKRWSQVHNWMTMERVSNHQSLRQLRNPAGKKLMSVHACVWLLLSD